MPSETLGSDGIPADFSREKIAGKNASINTDAENHSAGKLSAENLTAENLTAENPIYETFTAANAQADQAVLSSIASQLDEFLYSVNHEVSPEEIFFTESVRKITGYSPEELSGLPGRGQALIHAEDTFSVRRQISDFENDADKKSISLVYRIVNRSGQTLWLKETVKVERDSRGRILRSYGIVSDITELKQTELSLIRSQESLRQLNAAKDRFISIISHDLRAPFTSILGFAEILLNEPNIPEDEKKEYLNYIYESSQTQLQLVKYLLDWSRLQSGKIRIERSRIRATSLVQLCISALSGNALKKGIQIRVSIPEEIYIYADEKLLNQVITNLLNNALKFTPSGRSIEVSVNHFKKGFAEVVVKDEGVGISESNKSRIFKFDQKFSTDGTNGEKGSGLGLTLVKEIVEKHEGDIWFYSEEGKGSEFHFTIPEASNVVVLVEDDSSILTLMNKLVKKALPGFAVVTTTNGYEAMNVILREMPTLVITDHFMPLMNGIQLLESLRKMDNGGGVPAVVIAAVLSDDVREKYCSLGVSHFLNKPLDVQKFSQALCEVLSIQ